MAKYNSDEEVCIEEMWKDYYTNGGTDFPDCCLLDEEIQELINQGLI